MRKMYTHLITKASIAVSSLFLLPLQAFALCPRGYGEAEKSRNEEISAVMLDYKVSYLPEQLTKCNRVAGSYGAKCGSLVLDYLGDGTVSVKPADPSLKSIMFEGLSSHDLGAFNLPRNFQDYIDNEWCETSETKGGSSSPVKCYLETKRTIVHVPNQYLSDAIRKKIIVQSIYQYITKCSLIAF